MGHDSRSPTKHKWACTTEHCPQSFFTVKPFLTLSLHTCMPTASHAKDTMTGWAHTSRNTTRAHPPLHMSLCSRILPPCVHLRTSRHSCAQIMRWPGYEASVSTLPYWYERHFDCDWCMHMWYILATTEKSVCAGIKIGVWARETKAILPWPNLINWNEPQIDR